jgi:hypothetical protein
VSAGLATSWDEERTRGVLAEPRSVSALWACSKQEFFDVIRIDKQIGNR